MRVVTAEAALAERLSTLLMYAGEAEAALDLYESLFSDLQVVRIEHYENGAAEGLIKQAEWTLAGHRFISIDSPVEQPFSFTPCMSLFVDCADEPEIERLFGALSDGGAVLMPLDAYPFSTRFGWVQDRFGLSWQLNLP